MVWSINGQWSMVVLSQESLSLDQQPHAEVEKLFIKNFERFSGVDPGYAKQVHTSSFSSPRIKSHWVIIDLYEFCPQVLSRKTNFCCVYFMSSAWKMKSNFLSHLLKKLIVSNRNIQLIPRKSTSWYLIVFSVLNRRVPEPLNKWLCLFIVIFGIEPRQICFCRL